MPATPVSRPRPTGTVPVQRAREPPGPEWVDILSIPLLEPSHLCAHSYGLYPRLWLQTPLGGRSGWTSTSMEHAPPGAHYAAVSDPTTRRGSSSCARCA